MTHDTPPPRDLSNDPASSPSRPEGDAGNASLTGSQVGDYHVLRRIGRGGMADVYAAQHGPLGRQVALKVLRHDLAGNQEYAERFRREAQAAAKLSHPNIVHVYEVGRVGNHHFIAQELVDGLNLKEQVEKYGPLTEEEAVAVLRAVTLALCAAHKEGITHRDIKPENILRSHQGEIKVADFGLARLQGGGDLTQIGLTMGTPRYMSPEQVQGKLVDPRSDLYSLGCTLYYLLSGRPPFDAEEPLAVAMQHLNETAKPLSSIRPNVKYADWLLAAINRLMAKNPEDRFASAGALAEWVGEQSGLPTEAMTGGTAEATIRLQRAMQAETLRRRQAHRNLAIAACVPILAGIVGAWLAMPRNPRSVPRLLRPDRVPAKETVQQQFLAAVSRDDIAGWQAVREHFPPELNDTNASYAIKADIQLARLLIRQQRQDEASVILTRIAEDPAADRLFRVVAIAQLIDLANPDSRETAELWDKLRRAYQGLIEARPEAQRSLMAIIGADKVRRLESS